MPLCAAWLILSLALQSGGGYYGGFGGPVPDTFSISSLEPGFAAQPGSSCFGRVDIGLDKSQTIVFRAFGLEDGTYEVDHRTSLDWETVGSFKVEGDGLGKLAPASSPASDYFDWLGEWIQVRRGSEVVFYDYLDVPIGGFFTFDDHAVVQGVRLIAVGQDLDARGKVVFRRGDGQVSGSVLLERLDPGPYILDVDDAPVLYVDVDKKGRGGLQLGMPFEQGKGMALFFPEGEVVRVRNGAGEVVLAAHVPSGKTSHLAGAQKFVDLGDGAADGLQANFVQASYSYSGALAHGWLAWQRDALGLATLTVKLEQKTLPFFPYDIHVGDTLIGQIGVSTGEGDDPFEATFSLGADLDLRAQRVTVGSLQYPGLALFVPQSVPAAMRTYHKDVRKAHHLRLDLLNPGIDLDATGRLDWRVKKGVEQLQLDVHDLPAGAYDVAIDGVVVAAGTLVVEADGGDAEQLFSTDGVLEGSLPLDFTLGGALAIRAAATETVYLQQSLAH